MLQYEWRPGVPVNDDDVHVDLPPPHILPPPQLQHHDLPDPYFHPRPDQGANDVFDDQHQDQGAEDQGADDIGEIKKRIR